MHNPRSSAEFGILSCGLLSACLLLTGCDKTEQITVGTYPSHESIQTPKFQAQHDRDHPSTDRTVVLPPNRMIAVVIPQPDCLWFFKLEGEPDTIAAKENEVRDFLKSVRFPSPGEIDWTLPSGWRKMPGNQMRYATILLDGSRLLEMSVTRLPTQSEKSQAQADKTQIEQVIANINRWRGQLSLPLIDEEDLPTQSEKLTLNGIGAYWINIVGHPKPRSAGMGQMPPANQVANGKARRTDGPAYEKPENWTEGKPNGVAVVSLQARDGDQEVEITVTSAGGNSLDNVNRWRGQLKLEPIGEKELAESAKKVSIGPLSGELFEFSNDETAIYGAIVSAQDRSWFIKMKGDKELADQERSRFQAFLKSLRWN